MTPALITACWDNCKAHYMGLHLKTIQKPQLVQNVAVCAQPGAWHDDHVIPLCPGGFWMEIKVLVITYTALYVFALSTFRLASFKWIWPVQGFSLGRSCWYCFISRKWWGWSPEALFLSDDSCPLESSLSGDEIEFTDYSFQETG